LRGEGWTQVDSISPYAVYNVFYTALVGRRAMYGRDVLLLRERLGQRRGVTISMLSAIAGDRKVSSPLLVATKGALEGPLRSFALE
jgi:NAD(P)-dependent dehydrogenase (short-subunit alcohol dehydrogenase family)